MPSRKCKFKTKNLADLTNCLSSVMPEEKTQSAEIQFYTKYPNFQMKYFVQISTADVFTQRRPTVALHVPEVSLPHIQWLVTVNQVTEGLEQTSERDTQCEDIITLQ